jgi:hypothetical protein
MALFPVLEIENSVQVKDKTRISAIKSYVTTGLEVIENVSVEMGSGGTSIVLTPIGSPTPEAKAQDEWFTDWEWSSWSFDVDSNHNKIDIEQAGALYVATIASATYSTQSALASAIQTALNASGASGTFTVSVDETQKLVISNTESFKVLIETGENRFNGLLQHLGFEYDSNDSTEVKALPIEYGLKKITLSIDDGTNPAVTQAIYQKVYTEYGDRLFASDDELAQHEQDIKKWVPYGKNSFKFIHRRVVALIFEWLAKNGYQNSDRKKFTKWDIKDLKEVRDWAIFMALRLIMEGNSNAVGDIFDLKATKYSSLEIAARSRFLSIDIDQNGSVDFDENLRLFSINVFRR